MITVKKKGDGGYRITVPQGKQNKWIDLTEEQARIVWEHLGLEFDNDGEAA